MFHLLTFHTCRHPARALVEGAPGDLLAKFRETVAALEIPEYNPAVPYPEWAADRLERIATRCRELGIPTTEVEGIFLHELQQSGYTLVKFEEVDLVP